MIEFLFLDLDETILDFHKAEHIAWGKCIRSFGIEPKEEMYERYKEINIDHWKRLERKEITRDEVKLGRFAQFFLEFGIPESAEVCSKRYETFLSQGHYFIPGAEEALEILSKKYRLFLASNGTASVQAGRLKSANIGHFFEKIFVSEEVGANKPSIEYFDACFAQIPDFDKEKAMIVGDSLTSDILGGQNAGIKTCWVNPRHEPRRDDIRVDYEIENLGQLDALLETIKGV